MDGYFFRRFVFLLLFLACSNVYGQSNDSEKVWDLSKVSEWILERIRFPEEAYGYGKAGVEQMCLSVSWNGKVFLSAPLNTLHPAYAEEMLQVLRNVRLFRTEWERLTVISKWTFISIFLKTDAKR